MQLKVVTSLILGLAISGTIAAPASEDAALETREEQAKQDKQDKQDTQVANACAPGTWPCNDVPNADPNWRGNDWNTNNNDWNRRPNWRDNDDWNRRPDWRNDDNRWNRHPNRWNNNPNWRRPGWNNNNNNNGGYRQRCGCTSNGEYHPDIGQDACNDLGRTWSNLQFDWQTSTCLDLNGIGLEQNGWEAACQRVRSWQSDQWNPQAIRGVCTPY